MSKEDFEKTIEFILNQQAQSTSKIGQLEDIVARLANASLKRMEETDERIAVLVDSQIRLAEAQSRTDANLNRTDESLRNLIVVVDRYFSGNGGSGKSQS